MDFDRETVASAFVATGGAWLLGSAAFRRRSGRWNRAQLRGMGYAGVGFLLSAASARWLQHLGNRGIAVSLVGTTLAMRGMYTLLRERAAISAAASVASATPVTSAPDSPSATDETAGASTSVAALAVVSTIASVDTAPANAAQPRVPE